MGKLQEIKIMRTIKEDVKLLKEIKDQLFSEFNPDGISTVEMEQFNALVISVFENQNKWLLSDKISSEKQSRMDSYKADKAQGSNNSESSESPTPKQISYATMLGINVEGKSKSELSLLIEKAKKTEPKK